jgi:hypothetical protein
MMSICLLHTQLSSESESQLYFTTVGLPPIGSHWRQAPLRITTNNFISQLNTCGYSLSVTSSLMRRWVCRLQLLLVFASAVILRSESRRTHDHILLSHFRDSPNLQGKVAVFISPRNRVARLYPEHLVPFCRLLRLAGLRWRRYSTPPPHMKQLSTSFHSVDLFSVKKMWIGVLQFGIYVLSSICMWLLTGFGLVNKFIAHLEA